MRKKRRKAKPVVTKLFLHGATAVGENERFSAVADGYLPMGVREELQPLSPWERSRPGGVTDSHSDPGIPPILW